MWWGRGGRIRDQMLRTDHTVPSPCPLTPPGKAEVEESEVKLGLRKKGTLSFVLVSHYPTLFLNGNKLTLKFVKSVSPVRVTAVSYPDPWFLPSFFVPLSCCRGE